MENRTALIELALLIRRVAEAVELSATNPTARMAATTAITNDVDTLVRKLLAIDERIRILNPSNSRGLEVRKGVDHAGTERAD